MNVLIDIGQHELPHQVSHGSYLFFLVDFPQERCPVVLAPLLYPEKRDILMDRILPDSGELAKTMMESSLSEFMQEVGYGDRKSTRLNSSH